MPQITIFSFMGIYQIKYYYLCMYSFYLQIYYHKNNTTYGQKKTRVVDRSLRVFI